MLDFDEAVLRASKEPAAVVILADRAARQAKTDIQRRLVWKWTLTRRLYGLGLKQAEILELFPLVDWLLSLPPQLERRFQEQLSQWEGRQAMPYITSIEPPGIEKGFQQGQIVNCRQNILDLIALRFGQVPAPVRDRVDAESDLEKLRQWLRQAATCPSLDQALDGRR